MTIKTRLAVLEKTRRGQRAALVKRVGIYYDLALGVPEHGTPVMVWLPDNGRNESNEREAGNGE